MQNQTDVVTDCTSQVFDGLITLSNPRESWVAKWQRLTEYQEGVYATKIVGVVSFCVFLWDGGRRRGAGRMANYLIDASFRTSLCRIWRIMASSISRTCAHRPQVRFYVLTLLDIGEMGPRRRTVLEGICGDGLDCI